MTSANPRFSDLERSGNLLRSPPVTDPSLSLISSLPLTDSIQGFLCFLPQRGVNRPMNQNVAGESLKVNKPKRLSRKAILALAH